MNTNNNKIATPKTPKTPQTPLTPQNHARNRGSVSSKRNTPINTPKSKEKKRISI